MGLYLRTNKVKFFKRQLSFFLTVLLFNNLFSQNLKLDSFTKDINENELKNLLYVYASDFFKGRETGKLGQKRAVKFISEYYESLNIKEANGTENYFQRMNLNISGNIVETENVVSVIEGSEKPNEYIIISSHLDHEGEKNGVIYNGADDNGSGTIGVLKIAEAFQNAILLGFRPKRSIVFLHLTGEEKGLLGSKFYTDNPLYPLENTIVNLNIDMIGRIDPRHKNNIERYIYLIGTNLLSSELHEVSELTNKNTTNLYLDYKYNDIDQSECIYYRSDHFHFVKNNIPAIFYFNGVHEDYHKPTDTVEKIEYELLKDRIKLIFFTAWELANRNKSIEVDKNVDYSKLINCKRYLKLYNL
ncbi:MAG: peptidase M28 [Flavobacteriaceae bacterium]|nr:peptidase M28 [Flavobacteriaceae bacterium]|tara:strand:+ start:510 stop:1586 length:1077 start_codon:yes stop_codon:yes gene_type:complete